jgi:hypothetical protein
LPMEFVNSVEIKYNIGEPPGVVMFVHFLCCLKLLLLGKYIYLLLN